MKWQITFLFCLLLFNGCTTTVELTVDNNETFPLESEVVILGKNGGFKREIGLGQIDNNNDVSINFDVKNGGSFSVRANVPASGVIFNSNKITVTGKENPFTKKLTIKSEGPIVDDSKAFNTLSNKFKDIGNDLGAFPLAIKDALNTRIGSLIVAIHSENGNKGDILYSIPPNILDVYILTLDDIIYPDRIESEDIYIHGNTALSASSEISILGKFGINWNKDSVYEMKWVLRGFGVCHKKEDASKDPMAKFHELSENHKQAILSALRKDQKAKIYYINSFYILKYAEISIKEGSKLTAKADFSAINIVAADGVFSFEKAQEQKKIYQSTVLNYWGDELILQPVNEVVTRKGLIGVEPPIFYSQLVLVPTGNKIRFSTNEFK